MPRHRGWMAACVAVGDSRYGAKWYWARRYALHGERHEWLGLDFEALSGRFGKAFRRQDRLLELGCGTSSFADDARRSGYVSILAVDFCEELVDLMRRRYPLCSYRSADVTRLDGLDDASFDGVFDKGTLDGVLGEGSASDVLRARGATQSVGRVLRPGCLWISVGVSDCRLFADALIGAKDVLELEQATQEEVQLTPGGRSINIHVRLIRRK
eukprot:TRINITY_DN51057_c0_g1_i1.p1 TRINITY_DN51057_c0_g1~~TRINITY_DN51057_c0_g1_i1.p1  ORF type:complete len:213 (-),score=33.13 TRINITY_DN51057_c0_g1_i1:215-853(-)